MGGREGPSRVGPDLWPRAERDPTVARWEKYGFYAPPFIGIPTYGDAARANRYLSAMQDTLCDLNRCWNCKELADHYARDCPHPTDGDDGRGSRKQARLTPDHRSETS